MKSFIAKLFQMFQKPSALSLAQAELEEARRQLLVAQSSMEWARSLTDYHRARITRLEAILRNPV